MALPIALEGEADRKPPIIVIAIDQGEELFLAEVQDEAKPFLALLRDLLASDPPAIGQLRAAGNDRRRVVLHESAIERGRAGPRPGTAPRSGRWRPRAGGLDAGPLSVGPCAAICRRPNNGLRVAAPPATAPRTSARATLRLRPRRSPRARSRGQFRH